MESLTSIVLETLSLPWVHSMLWTIALLIATTVISKLATRALRHLLQRDNNPLPNASIFIYIARAVVWLLGGSIVLDNCFGINASAILGALGVGGIAVSLGFQDTLANLIGGLQVTFMGIVKPGDNIEVGAETGVVQDVSWRHTTIKDGLGQTVIIPNSIISKTALVHLLPANRVTVPFATPRDANLDALGEHLTSIANTAAANVCPIECEARIIFTEISELGIKGKVILTVSDAARAPVVTDVIVRAIAGELR